MASAALLVSLGFSILVSHSALATSLVRKDATQTEPSAMPSLETIEAKLDKLEQQFGGLVHHVPMHRDAWKAVAKEDPRTFSQVAAIMTGGDRFCAVKEKQGCHGYGPAYAKYMQHMLAEPLDEHTAVAEVGILKGSGLAVWSTMFPEAAILGFDLDIHNTQDNMAFLKKQGAFAKSDVQLHTYDQFKDNTALVKQALGQKKLVFVVEDGHHTDGTSAETFDSFYPNLSGEWLYVVEDAKHYTGEFEKHMKEKYVDPKKVEMHKEHIGDDVLFFLKPLHM